jgi:hypothetical protein
MTMQTFDVEFDIDDGVNTAAMADLIDDLHEEDAGLQTEVQENSAVAMIDGLSLVLLVTLAMTTATGAAVLAAFLVKTFHTGVTIKCKKGRYVVKKDKELPRGSVLIVDCKGKPQLKESMSEKSLTSLIKTILESKAD